MLILSSSGYLQPNKNNTVFFEKYCKGKKLLIVLNATLSGSNTKARETLKKIFPNLQLT